MRWGVGRLLPMIRHRHCRKEPSLSPSLLASGEKGHFDGGGRNWICCCHCCYWGQPLSPPLLAALGHTAVSVAARSVAVTAGSRSRCYSDLWFFSKYSEFFCPKTFIIVFLL
ncbi:uncharacterized protein DS421_16g538160 [Arachis hypogaea]|nr:uncharacterized protein DS421_16g538160 [Arachis hypogaea]